MKQLILMYQPIHESHENQLIKKKLIHKFHHLYKNKHFYIQKFE